MTIASLRRTLSQTILTLGVVSLVACGGGGGDGKKEQPVPDTTPNAYSYTATNNAELSAVITSAPVAITGINAATPVSITGGEYSINGGAFTSVAGTVTNGQTITIRLTAPASNSTSASTQLTVGGVAATFTVTTKADTTPNAYSYTATTNAEPSTVITSAPVTITGINAATPVSITGGEYSINGGAFTSAAGTVTSGQTITIRLTAPAANSTSASAQITVGGVTATFTVTTKADTTPNAYSYTATTNAEPSTVITSAPVTITGINAATPVSITGGEYSINGGAFTSAAGTVTSGQTITIRLTAPAANSTSASAQLTVGGVAATFTVTTKADTTPDTFSFTARTNASLNTEYTSNTITVAGIDAAVPVSITGGTYSVNGGAFTAAAGTVSVNNTVVVKGTSTSASESTHNVVLTIGGVSATYAITTVADTTPPVAEFKFPTPYTMSEAMSVKVRGTATDDNAIANVKVVVRSFKLDTPTDTISTAEINATPKAEGDYSSWTVDVPLTALAENEVKVVATDDRNNVTQLSDANKVVIRQANVASAFPDEVNQFADATVSALDTERKRILVTDWRKVMTVDINTGQRTVFAEHASMCSGYLQGLTIDHLNSRLYGLCEGSKMMEFNLLDGTFIEENILYDGVFYGVSLDRAHGRNQLVLVEQVYEFSEGEGGRIMAFSLDSKELSIISEASEQPIIKGASSSGGIAIDGDSYWVTSGGQLEDATLHKVIEVNALTGKREVFADNTIGSGELFSALLPSGSTAALAGVVKDTKNNRIIVMEDIASRLLAIDLITGVRSMFKDVSYVGTTRKRAGTGDLDLDENNEFLLLTDNSRKALILIDLETREKVILTKSKNDLQ